jgi:hypothetical protein
VPRLCARALALLALCAALYDGSACLIALATAPPAAAANDLVWRAPCPCGCGQHAPTLIGVGISQPAAPQALAELPRAERPAPPRAPDARLPSAPSRAIDHVPIALARA